MAIKINGVTVIDDDKVFNVGSGTTAERPDPASDGMWRYNTDLEIYEIYVDSSWTSFASAVTTSQPSGMLQLFPTGTASSTWVNIRSGQNPVLSQASYPNLYSLFGLRSNVIAWTTRTVGTLTSGSSLWASSALGYGNGVYIVAGPAGAIYSSTNAVNWTARTSNTTSAFNTVVYGNSLHIVGGNGGLLRTSPDSINWTTRSYGAGTAINASTYGNGLYVLGGGSGSIRSSTDAANWTAGTSGTTSAINALTYGNGVYVAACGVSEIRTSTNAINWTLRTSNTTSQIGYLLYGGGQFLYSGGQSLLGTSTDAINWTTRSFGAVSNGLAYGAGYYATGQWVSKDAITWVPRSNSNGSNLVIMCYGDNGFVHTYYSGLGGSGGLRSWYPYTYDITTEFVPPSVVPFSNGTSLYTTLNYNAPDYPSQYIKR